MATYGTDLTVLTACDASTGWSELPAPHAAGAAPALEEENYFHNAASVSQATGQGVNQTAGIQYDHGSDVTWTAASNWVFMIWTFYGAPTNLKTWALGGMRLGIGSADNNADIYNAMGNNFGKYPYGGWQNTAFDPEFATPDQTIGTPGSTYRNIAVLPNVTAKITKGSPLAVDVIRYGRGEFQVSGTGATFSGMATANDNDTTGRWGLFQLFGKGYEWKGLMSLGLSGTAVTFSDSNKSISIEDTPRVLAGFNKIEINHIDSDVTWNTVSITGDQTSITGSAPVSPGDFEVVDNATLDWDACTFTDMGTFIFNAGTNPNDIDVSIFRRCGLVTQNGADFTGCTFDKPKGTALNVDDLDIVTKNTFNSTGTGYAIDLGTIDVSAGDVSLDWDNILSGYGSSQTTNAAIVVNVTNGGTNQLIINVASTGTVPTVNNTGTGGASDVSIVTGQVTLLIKVVDDSTGLALPDARVWIGKESDKSQLLYTLTDVNGEASVALSYTADLDVVGWVRQQDLSGVDYVQKDVSGTLTSSGLTIAVRLQPI